jgi:membrane-bound inhibitor of C-type lysozyme
MSCREVKIKINKIMKNSMKMNMNKNMNVNMSTYIDVKMKMHTNMKMNNKGVTYLCQSKVLDVLQLKMIC